jgi:hypothetical protein
MGYTWVAAYGIGISAMGLSTLLTFEAMFDTQNLFISMVLSMFVTAFPENDN